MNIAFSVGNFAISSGIVRVVRNIIKELSGTEEHKVTLICTGMSDPAEQYLPDNVTVYNLDIEKYGRRKKYLKYVGALKSLFRHYKPDVLIVSGMEHVLFYTLGSLKLKGTKRIAWEHRNFTAGSRFRLEWLGKRWALRNWDGVLCITKKDYEQYRKCKGNGNYLYQIYNLTDFSCPAKTYNTASKRIMSCGYLDPIKGYDMLLSVAEKVFAEKPEWAWDIYGDGDLRNDLKQEIKARGLENHVRLMGYDPNVQSRYGDYAFFVLTSRAEGMGMVLIEAQKAGLPVISFDIFCGPSDVISDEVNGYLIPPFDIDEMSRKIITLIEDHEKRKQFSEYSEMHHAEFEKQVIIQRWRKMLGLPG